MNGDVDYVPRTPCQSQRDFVAVDGVLKIKAVPFRRDDTVLFIDDRQIIIPQQYV
jgi:hypothetical protein